ncbi:pilus assembly protein PilB [Vibrio zhanjiangensis]|uniref:Pilus assembly protein PilB n=1 Tax=Vibrio zhanjiangensis TaxID=1046128 RepID=A0ABQ6F3Q4_9VIBR|nr:ATPase, T2SS/T4P/T4SS family [Vibrio zhanjiangensis]GLT20153.1 pilus assembly protein PilB [Vibrio zhanjiangensis]
MTQLPDFLHSANIISAEQVKLTFAAMADNKTDVCSALMEFDNVTSKILTEALSKLFNLPIVSLERFDYQSCCKQWTINHLIRQHLALPLAIQNNRLVVAVTDPSDSSIEQAFYFTTGFHIKPVLIDISLLISTIKSLLGSDKGNLTHRKDNISLHDLQNLIADEGEIRPDVEQDSSPISRYIHQIIVEAVRKKASDIHFEPYDGWFRIRFRCDGLLIEVEQPPYQICKRLVARLKILAQLDISERRLPQDGRITLNLAESTPIHIRMSTLPTMWGEKVVLRILDNQVISLDLEVLGYSYSQRLLFEQALNKPQGLILITGPTGSGKTQSLYTGLTILNNQSRNIAAAEDPIEISLSGINQVQIQPQIGFGFAEALRAFLRQDPDVIMVGEIRDKETADIATKAAQTGHLVLATLHTNSSTEAIDRLKNIGIEPHNIATSLILVIAQRLLRRLCPLCKSPTDHPDHASELEKSSCYQASNEGCSACNQGYLGRIGIYEMLNITPELSHSILKNAPVHELEKIAKRQGMTPLYRLGMEKICQGVTSYAEVQRVLA